MFHMFQEMKPEEGISNPMYDQQQVAKEPQYPTDTNGNAGLSVKPPYYGQP